MNLGELLAILSGHLELDERLVEGRLIRPDTHTETEAA